MFAFLEEILVLEVIFEEPNFLLCFGPEPTTLVSGQWKCEEWRLLHLEDGASIFAAHAPPRGPHRSAIINNKIIMISVAE